MIGTSNVTPQCFACNHYNKSFVYTKPNHYVYGNRSLYCDSCFINKKNCQIKIILVLIYSFVLTEVTLMSVWFNFQCIIFYTLKQDLFMALTKTIHYKVNERGSSSQSQFIELLVSQSALMAVLGWTVGSCKVF